MLSELKLVMDGFEAAISDPPELDEPPPPHEISNVTNKKRSKFLNLITIFLDKVKFELIIVYKLIG